MGTFWTSVVAKMNLTCGGRLLERLEQRVEGRLREHVDFVDDVDLVACPAGPVLTVAAQFADVIDAVVAGAVDFEHVDVVAAGDLTQL